MDALQVHSPTSEGEPSGPATPTTGPILRSLHIQPQHKTDSGLHHVPKGLNAQNPDLTLASGAYDGLGEQQIEHLRTRLANIAPDNQHNSAAYDPYTVGLTVQNGQQGQRDSDSGSHGRSTPSLEAPGQDAPHDDPQKSVETMAERAAGKRPVRQGAASTGSQTSDSRLVSNLSASEVQFYVLNQEPEPPTLEELRDRVTKQFPFLLHRYEPGNKPRKPHENPPAVDKSVRARFKPLTPEEERVLLKSLKVNVDTVVEQSVIRGMVVLEKRDCSWKRLGSEPPADRDGQVQVVERAPHLPSAWLLPLDTSSHVALGKAKSKKTFRLPEYEAMAGCSSCEKKGQTLCPLCRAAEPDECFWCDGTGIRKRKPCDNCHGRKIHACLNCDARGYIECKECSGKGLVWVGAFVDVKFRTVHLPPIAVSDLVYPSTGMYPTTPDEVSQCAKIKMSQTISELTRTLTGQPSPSVPVIARCVWHKSVKRTVSIWRPTRVAVPGARKLGRKLRAKKQFVPPAEKQEGDLHRFLVSSDKNGPIIEITQRNGTSSLSRSGVTTPNPIYMGSGNVSRASINSPTPSALNTPPASVANLQAIWGSEAPGAPSAPPSVPTVAETPVDTVASTPMGPNPGANETTNATGAAEPQAPYPNGSGSNFVETFTTTDGGSTAHSHFVEPAEHGSFANPTYPTQGDHDGVAV